MYCVSLLLTHIPLFLQQCLILSKIYLSENGFLSALTRIPRILIISRKCKNFQSFSIYIYLISLFRLTRKKKIRRPLTRTSKTYGKEIHLIFFYFQSFPGSFSAFEHYRKICARPQHAEQNGLKRAAVNLMRPYI